MRLLLHACCGPCSLVPLRALRAEGHDVTGYFANPNIHPVSEYLRRREAMQMAAEHEQLPMIWQDDAYSMEGWLAAVHERGIADNADGARCRFCYAGRLTLTAAAALAHGFEGFTSSLLYSRYQRHDMIREEGERAAALVRHHADAPVFHYADFRSGWQQGIDASKAMGLFRQQYCACIFSEAERYARQLRKLCEA